jgi:hypothetical protein
MFLICSLIISSRTRSSLQRRDEALIFFMNLGTIKTIERIILCYDGLSQILIDPLTVGFWDTSGWNEARRALRPVHDGAANVSYLRLRLETAPTLLGLTSGNGKNCTLVNENGSERPKICAFYPPVLTPDVIDSEVDVFPAKER